MARTVPPDRLDGATDPTVGLSDAQAAARAARYGPNRILEAAPAGLAELLKETATDPMLWFLVGTSAVFAALGQWGEALVLFVALLPLLGMDAYLHRRTHASVDGLSSRLASTATVERDGVSRRIAATELVPGDLVSLAAGDAFPADGLIVGGERMQADESALTGEAFPVAKTVLRTRAGGPDPAAVDDASWGLAGTRLLSGAARMRVVFTGGETRYGEIARSANVSSHARTPLQSAVDQLVRVLVFGAVLLCLVLAWVRFQQGHGLVDALLSAMTLAVAALPEEFPVVLTFFLGVGVYRLAKRQALVRRAIVVENIGRITCICSDKTGTITEGRLRLAHREPAQGIGEAELSGLAAIASRRETADPMDLAILDAGAAPPALEVVATFPFTEDRRRETGIVRRDGTLVAAVKGAPEVVLAQCTLSASEHAAWIARIDAYAASGHKVIACAVRELDASMWPGGEPDRSFRFAGLLCFEDPVRPRVAEALQTCRDAGIRVVMVTGDHIGTATAVAREIGLGGGAPRAIEGAAFSERLDRREPGLLDEVDVIARAVPSHKLELVRAMQARGEIVAVTGDGVNDVPALQAADVGIAMGERGTRSAREVAAIVLLDDDFSSIVRAIAEGRQLFTNLQSSFQYLLMIHLPLVLTAALIPLGGYPILYLPIHIVWLELVIHPTALLVFQALPGDGRLRPLRRGGAPRFFGRVQWASIVAVSMVVTAVVTGSYLAGLASGQGVDHARSVALAVLTAASAGITVGLTRLRGRESRISVGLTLLLSVLLVQVPLIAPMLHLTPLDLHDWLFALAGAVAAALLAAVPGFWRDRTASRPTGSTAAVRTR